MVDFFIGVINPTCGCQEPQMMLVLLGNQGPEACIETIVTCQLSFQQISQRTEFWVIFQPLIFTIGSLQGFRLLLSRKFGLCSSTDLLEKFLGIAQFHVAPKLKKHAAPFPFGRQAAAWRVSLDPDGNGHISFGPLSWDVPCPRRGLRNLVPFDDETSERKPSIELTYKIQHQLGRYISLSQIPLAVWFVSLFILLFKRQWFPYSLALFKGIKQYFQQDYPKMVAGFLHSSIRPS